MIREALVIEHLVLLIASYHDTVVCMQINPTV